MKTEVFMKNLHSSGIIILQLIPLLHIGDIPARPWYDYYLILRANALGNFKQLVKAMTLSPAMLCYLNGNTNKKTSPNENYGQRISGIIYCW